MTEKTRSISISGSGGIGIVGAPILISGPTSSSPSSLIGGLTTGPLGSSGGGGGGGGGGHSSSSGGGGGDNESELGGHDLSAAGAGDTNSIMNSSQISTTSNDSVSITKTSINYTHNIGGSSCRFPKLEECAHFHYERVQLGSLSVRLADEKSELLTNSIASQSIGGDVVSTSQNNQTTRNFTPSSCWFIMKVISSRSDPFLIKRSFDNLRMLDEMLHRCVYDRKISGLKDLLQLDFKTDEDVEYAVAKYLERFSKIASDSLTCGTILTWFQLDNKGRRLPLADTDTMRSINTPAVGAAYGVRRYVAQACDEISIEVGDMISVIDMPSPAESIWWRGKKSHQQKSHYEVGFFPQSCVATIGDKVPRHFPLPAPLVGQLDVSPTKPVLRKHGKLIAFFRSFILSRPSRRRLKQTGIYRERVFSCDLSEHLLNSGQEIPMVLKCCAEFIEENGIVDGIYRLSGITSNIQKLRRAFDEERVPDLSQPDIRQDIHAVSSLLKMYFRELPNPLCTYQLYDNFVEAIQTKSDSNERLRLMKETVLKLPPPHYRTLKYLATHLNKISRHSASTGMTDKNLAIVWAPNLLRSPALESGGVAALRGVGVQAVVTEYLIRNCNLIFDPSDEYNRSGCSDQRMDSLTDCESLLVEQREHDQSLSLIERPKSLSAGGAKLISLEEAQERHSRLEGYDSNKSIPINTPSTNVGSYIEVGGGPSSLPDKYHTVLPVPRSWQKRKTHSWKSLFSRNPRNSNSNNDIKALNVSSPIQKEPENSLPYSESEVHETQKSHDITINALSQQKPKSIDLFDGKPMDICIRSNSIDSLRTAGHSRSVSHDSYFDLLQSPLRSGGGVVGVVTCPSRELSELGLNFDREEAEMRIFSESESLVSSPKVGKENIPPTRRPVLRARPEEFSSTGNSVNPSPKKQPRLNLLSPSDPPIWNHTVCEESHNDESCCKRYKLEDQLSDIQFIDCSTPEHTITNSNTVYTSVQIHNPPASLSKSASFNDDTQTLKRSTNSSFEAIFEQQQQHHHHHQQQQQQNQNKSTESPHHISTRYSYPVMHLAGKRKENDAALKERFSYPGSANSSKYVCRMPPPSSDVKLNIEEEKRDEITHQKRNNFTQKTDLIKSKNRYSYCETVTSASSTDIHPSVNFLLRSSSADLVKNKNNEMERSKLSVMTPSSPIQSPRYSLLVGETSSENSSAVNTPIFEMDLNSHPEICTRDVLDDDEDDEIESGRTHCNLVRNNFDTKDFGCILSEDSCSNLTSQLSHNTNDKRDISAIKRELSLDLEGGGSKMSVDLTDISLSSNNKQIINIPSSPNNSNFTHTSDNTSQSITPSEFGYQHLNRQSNAVSLENSPKFEEYDNLEQAFMNYDKTPIPLNPSPSKTKLPSPIKATISITYNVKSPMHNKSPSSKPSSEYETISIMHSNDDDREKTNSKPLLETSFDENMVYEQVKFFRSSVSEVNEILNNGNNDLTPQSPDVKIQNQHQQIVPDMRVSINSCCDSEVNSNLIVVNDDDVNDSQKIHQYSGVSDDVLMDDNIDSLEIDQNYSLYENVEMRKPPTVYENIEISSNTTKSVNKSLDKKENGQLGGNVSPIEMINKRSISLKSTTQSSSSNFSVKQLATKFETSPVEQMPPFDFNTSRSSKKIDNVIVTNRDAPCYVRAKNHNKQLNKSAQITRSLDENAFIREFGHKRLEDITKSAQQIEKIDETRRKSFDFARPKSLNPPKHLPNLQSNNSLELCKVVENSKLKLDLVLLDEKYPQKPEIKITPTTENRISLIQNNVDIKSMEDDNTGVGGGGVVGSGGGGGGINQVPSSKVLSGVKLDRERIERIKEERRHQLSEKYRTESFKSKSKTELREFPKDDKYQSESLRIKSKSRGDIRNFQKEIDNLKGCSEIMNFSNRIRRISDEKNQNNCESILINNQTDDDVLLLPSTKVGGSINNKFDRKSIDFPRERDAITTESTTTTVTNTTTTTSTRPITRNSISSTREKISPQFSIRDVTAMFESRSQNQ